MNSLKGFRLFTWHKAQKRQLELRQKQVQSPTVSSIQLAYSCSLSQPQSGVQTGIRMKILRMQNVILHIAIAFYQVILIPRKIPTTRKKTIDGVTTSSKHA